MRGRSHNSRTPQTQQPSQSPLIFESCLDSKQRHGVYKQYLRSHPCTKCLGPWAIIRVTGRQLASQAFNAKNLWSVFGLLLQTCSWAFSRQPRLSKLIPPNCNKTHCKLLDNLHPMAPISFWSTNQILGSRIPFWRYFVLLLWFFSPRDSGCLSK
ncbi:hypothetical protein BOTBODRAFT_204535 [Botryobasidium botryosum FD-172 SS1]|uniref:Uncharacterized protein n=1 Tax=Botryobasidium botryosum (strain FD-172 SS1) TaxID=930990 RepID=A0A067N0U0_BOTB1|nr:hypothetical protein BOTBODRAFT_204535 [Botryobasidium botryosum FD-172 SS1]